MAIEVLSVHRIGQISGTTGKAWPLLVDPVGSPLLTDTGKWNVIGVDEGATAEHNGRLYVFFGDVATDQSGNPPENADLVAWTDEPAPLRHGGHLAMGLNFQLPITARGIEGQPDWQFCLKCSALFWNGDAHFKGRCSRDGGTHDTFGLGLNFSLPFEPTGSPGQHQWRFCGKCASLFWEGDPATAGACPAGGVHSAAGWKFVIPTTPGPRGGQEDWRFCAKCHGLFYDGYPGKGVCCGAAGGGIHLTAVTQDGSPTGRFDPFRGPEPIGYTGSLETPNAAFSFDGRMYVLAGFADPKYSNRKRPGDPQPGQYLFSKADPSKPGAYDTEFMQSPKLGWCATNAARATFQSHAPLGLHFALAHDLAPAANRRNGWRSCLKCEAVYFDGNPSFKGVCQRGGAHQPDPAVPDDFSLEVGATEDVQNQSNWKQCKNCLALYWSADANDTGLCPASGKHVPTGEVFRAPHNSIEPFALGQPDWRFCDKCNGLFWSGADHEGVCPRDGGPHHEAGFNFQVKFSTSQPSVPSWRFCVKCAALFHEGNRSLCPKDRAAHVAAGWFFTPSQSAQPTLEWQGDWRRCSKCAGLYYDGFADKGCCPTDGRGHAPSPGESDFRLPHNPGADAHTRDQLRFCTRCHGMVRTDQPVWFPFTGAAVVQNAQHPALGVASGQGLMMISYDWRAFRLSWMPLVPGHRPVFEATRYFHAGKRAWTDTIDSSPGYELFVHPFPGQYTHVCASWLPGPQCWVVLFGTASDKVNQDKPIVARFSADLLHWSEEVPLFDPDREGAYGAYMHDPARGDHINPNLPPAQPPGQDMKGWAYGAFLIDRYTNPTWNAQTRILTLTYLMSPSSPYQVQLMETTVRLPNPIVG